MRREYNFSVVGTPAPQGSKSFKGIRNGHAILAESSKKVKPWRQDVAAAALEARAGRQPIDGPVCVSIWFHLQRPKSAPRRRTEPDRKPDLDKLIRSTLDAIVTSGMIHDDAQVVHLNASKQYASTGSPIGAQISVREFVFVGGDV